MVGEGEREFFEVFASTYALRDVPNSDGHRFGPANQSPNFPLMLACDDKKKLCWQACGWQQSGASQFSARNLSNLLPRAGEVDARCQLVGGRSDGRNTPAHQAHATP